jgi:putative ABC transport system permease protein
MLVLAIFALMAVVLAAVGIYGVISYSVVRRTEEIGIRIALGAVQSRILRMIMWHGLALTMIGVTIGVGGALALMRLLAAMLYQVSPADALTFAAVGLFLVIVALCATYLPARRATKIDPAVAMRSE